jgi:predicted NUDIX family NTP pyrophosphohydrolase
MPKKSAGLLLYRFQGGELQVFLVHPGGPFWARKDVGAWSIPKGEFEEEEPLEAAKREFGEETGLAIDGEFILLKPVTQKNGKVVHAWAVQADIDPEKIHSNTFEIEWPPKSGKTQEFPEVDRAAWFLADEGMEKINPAQAGLIGELQEKISQKE